MKTKFLLLLLLTILLQVNKSSFAREMKSARQIELRTKTPAQHRSIPITPAAFIEDALVTIDLLSTVPTATVVVKDALLNSYQVFVKKSISAYQVKHFTDWEDIDVVISTVDVELPVDKPFARVNVIFNQDDYIKLDLLGLQKRNVLTNYFAIERRLDFLNDEDKHRVMAVIKEELGYKEVKMPRKFKTLSDLLGVDDIKCVKQIDDWKDAVKASTDILKHHGNDGDRYCENVIEGIEVRGFYSVTDEVFALLHGSENAGIQVSCMSLLISEQPVRFGEKEVNLIFCLASRDKKEHIPVVTRLMRMVSRTDLIKDLKECRTPEDAMAVIRRCEKEVEQHAANH